MSTDASNAATQGARYRYDHPRMYPDVLNDMFFSKHDLRPGDNVGEFELELVGGGTINNRHPDPTRPYTLLVFGSLTCPVTESAADGLNALYQQYRSRIRFVMVNVREAHPGKLIPQPKSIEAKVKHALRLKLHHAIQYEVAIDDIDGTFHRRLGGRPNSAYLIDATGTIQLRVQWANEFEAIDEALRTVTAGRGLKQATVTNTFHAMCRMIGFMNPVMKAAGRGSKIDTWIVAPPLGILMELSTMFFFLRRQHKGLPSMVAMAVLIGGGTLLL